MNSKHFPGDFPARPSKVINFSNLLYICTVGPHTETIFVCLDIFYLLPLLHVHLFLYVLHPLARHRPSVKTRKELDDQTSGRRGEIVSGRHESRFCEQVVQVNSTAKSQ